MKNEEYQINNSKALQKLDEVEKKPSVPTSED